MESNQNNNSIVNTTSPVEAQTQVSTIAWQLVGISPSLSDLTIDIGTSLSIGRSDTNDVILAAPQVSRQHAILNRSGDKLYVQDLGSSNGTFVNNQRLDSQAVELHNTDELAIADLVFLVTSEQIDELVDDNFLQNLADIQSVNTTPTVANQPLPANTEPTASIDIITTQDFVPDSTPQTPVTNNQLNTNTTTTTIPTTTETKVNTTHINEEAVKTPPSLTDIPQNAQPMPQQTSIDTASLTDKSMPNLQATTNPTTITSNNQPNITPPKVQAKKNSLLAIIIIIIIAAIIIGSLFLK